MVEEIPALDPELHFLVCTNRRSAQTSSLPSCGPRMDEKTVSELKIWLQKKGWTQKIYLTQTSCLGGCNAEGGVIAVHPPGKFYRGFQTLADIQKFIEEQVEASSKKQNS